MATNQRKKSAQIYRKFVCAIDEHYFDYRPCLYLYHLAHFARGKPNCVDKQGACPGGIPKCGWQSLARTASGVAIKKSLETKQALD
jgi:hypothetical protein